VAPQRATHITPIVLHLRPGVREVFWPWLTEQHPELVDRYRSLYRRSDAAEEYRTAVTDFVASCREAAWRRHPRPKPPEGWRLDRDGRRSNWNRGYGDDDSGGEQLQLL
jgi:DNA repair photolyase